MNRVEAKRISEAGEISLGELRSFIRKARGTANGKMSRVNPQFTLAMVCDTYLSALGGRLDSETPAGMRRDNSGRMKPTRDGLIIRNILRDCA